MTTSLSSKRLRKEYLHIQRNPVENITTVPLEENILEWYYVIKGTPNSPYEGGYYFGKLKFPPEYPLKPPSVIMFTPNGRFKPNRRLCLSMSDFHPETWNPMWSVSTILTGLYSFMLDDAPTLGSMETSEKVRRKLAAESLDFNCQDKMFVRLFPDLVRLNVEQKAKREAEQMARGRPNGTDSTPWEGGEAQLRRKPTSILNTVYSLFIVLIALVFAITWNYFR